MPNRAAPKERRHPFRRLVTVAAVALVAFVVLLSAVLAVVDTDAVARRVVDYLLPKVSTKLGREVTITGAHARILPNPHVSLEGFTIHGKGDEPALVEAKAADVDLALWPLITSLGQNVRIQNVTLLQPELNLLRGRDGKWNYEDLGGSSSSNRVVVISAVSVDGGTLRIIDRSTSHGEATVALTRIELRAQNIGPGLPMSLSGKAAFASEEQNLSLDMSVSRLPETFKDLSPNEWPQVSGLLSITNGSLARLEGLLPAKVGRLINGGHFNFDAQLSTARDGRYTVAGDASLRDLQLRGSPASGSVHVNAAANPADLSGARVELNPIALSGPGLDLGGSAVMAGSPLQVEFALRGQKLDLQTLLGVLPEEEQAQSNHTAMLPARMRQRIDGISASGTLQLDEVVDGKLSAQNLRAQARLQNGVLTLTQGEADVFGGKVDASGTTVNLTQPLPTWNLRARMQQVDLGNAMAALSGAAAVQGKVDAALNLTGKGADWAEVQKNLTGEGALALEQGALTSTDLGEKLAAALAEGLRQQGHAVAGTRVEQAAQGTPLKELRTRFTVKDGWMVLRDPLGFTSSMGAVKLDGKIGLDHQLDLQGAVTLSEPFLQQVAPRGVPLKGPVQVPLAVGGKLESPAVQPPTPSALAEAAVKGAVKGRAQGVQEEVKRQARKRLGGFLERLGNGK